VGFFPHGIGLHQDGAEASLFVINPPHRLEKGWLFGFKWSALDDQISRFRWNARDGVLERVGQPISDTAFLTGPNDIHPVAHDAFFVTNTPGLSSLHRALFRLPSTDVVHYVDGAFRKFAGPFAFPNGITGVGDRLFVAESQTGEIHEFDLTETVAPDKREPTASYRVGSLVDNLEWGREIDGESAKAGDELWIGAHPSVTRFLRAGFIKSHDNGPSRVIRLSGLSEGKSAAAAIEYDEDAPKKNKTISTSSVAAPFTTKDGQRKMLIGSVFDPHILLCEEVE